MDTPTSRVIGRKASSGTIRRVELHLECGHHAIEDPAAPGKIGDEVACSRCAASVEAEASTETGNDIAVFAVGGRSFRARCKKCGWESTLGERGLVTAHAGRHRCR